MTKSMKLPNGDVIELGGYGVTRDGRKVGPMRIGHGFSYPFIMRGTQHTADGHYWAHKSLAPNDIIAAWKEPVAEPVPFKDMTDAEKGALLLAKFYGKGIEVFGRITKTWKICDPLFNTDAAYRVAPPAPKVEHARDRAWFGGQKVTACYTTIDGVVDIASYRLEPRDD